jgi:hypothetical protein
VSDDLSSVTKTPSPRRIVLVAPLFAPANVAGAYRPLHLARHLADRGHDVRVVTRPFSEIHSPEPSLQSIFPDGDRVLRVASGRSLNDLYHSVRRLLPSGQAPPVSGTGSHSATTGAGSPSATSSGSAGGGGAVGGGDGGGMRQLVSEGLSFPDGFQGWVRPATKAAVEWLASDPPDLVFVSGPPFSGFDVARALADRFQPRLVIDFRDPWGPGTGPFRRYQHPYWLKRSHELERDAIARSDLVLFNSPRVHDHATREFERYAPRMRTILNGTAAPRAEAPAALPTDGPLRFTHLGELYVGRHLRSLVRALSKLAGDGFAEPGFQVEQFGIESNDAALGRDLVTAPGVVVHRHGLVSRMEALAQAQAPGVLVVVQAPAARAQIPSKVFDCLATGNPVIVVASEDSAVWDLAREFDRCHRIDLDATPRNTEVLGELVRRWRAGELQQVRTIEDTAHLSRTATGLQMVEALEAVLGG